MPKGIPNPKMDGIEGTRRVTLTLRETEWAKLERLAADQYRTPELQAAWLLKQVLSTVNGVAETAERIVARSHARQNGEA